MWRTRATRRTDGESAAPFPPLGLRWAGGGREGGRKMQVEEESGVNPPVQCRRLRGSKGKGSEAVCGGRCCFPLPLGEGGEEAVNAGFELRSRGPPLSSSPSPSFPFPPPRLVLGGMSRENDDRRPRPRQHRLHHHILLLSPFWSSSHLFPYRFHSSPSSVRVCMALLCPSSLPSSELGGQDRRTACRKF